MADLATVLAPDPPAFALVHRSATPERVEILLGAARAVDRLADLPLPPVRPGRDGHDLLAVVPYRQLTERGFGCHDDGTPLLVLQPCARGTATVAQALAVLPSTGAVLGAQGFDAGDDEYRAVVRRVLADEIGAGEGSNFVIRRSFVATVANHSPRTALGIFRRLLALERGAYWTFVVHCGGRTLVGATPERHVSLDGGVAAMTPISGTYRYPAGGPSTAGLLRFLADRKETDELYMVVDEELKMLGRICHDELSLTGPRLTEMAHLAHTEYSLAGRTGMDVREVLRQTMFAPTVTGSPLENACRVIERHEPRGRGYYGGVLALIGQRGGRRTLDSAILIRTADIRADGRLEIGVGATLVRHSDPDGEVAETRAKAAGLLAAIGGAAGPVRPLRRNRALFGTDPRVAAALTARNERLAPFWLGQVRRPSAAVPAGRRVLVVDAGDAFTAMIAYQLRALRLAVTVRPVGDGCLPAGYDAVLAGPGPGDPRLATEPRIAALRRLIAALIAARTPLVAVCLGHQVLASVLGLPLRRRPAPAQGEQREIDLFGRAERVGFYNTFAAYAGTDRHDSPLLPEPLDVSRDPGTGEVHALRGPGVRSVQFHPESVLTVHGSSILQELIVGASGG
nr:anthranilate synthase family protein [Phytohabitans rumicis]